jgi:hypothetical protein
MSAVYFGCLAAALMVVTGAYHLTGLRDLGPRVSDETSQLVRAAWTILAIDWFLIAAVMVATSLGAIPEFALVVAGVFPLAAALVLGIVVGFRFPGVWLLALAGSCSLMAGTA